MKRDGILHAELAREVARLGRTHRVVVADRGLPLPPRPSRRTSGSRS